MKLHTLYHVLELQLICDVWQPASPPTIYRTPSNTYIYNVQSESYSNNDIYPVSPVLVKIHRLDYFVEIWAVIRVDSKEIRIKYVP